MPRSTLPISITDSDPIPLNQFSVSLYPQPTPEVGLLGNLEDQGLYSNQKSSTRYPHILLNNNIPPYQRRRRNLKNHQRIQFNSIYGEELMDREPEELQFLGLIGIYTESSKLIFKWRKDFSKITLALLLPLTFIFLAQTQISEVIITKIINYEEAHASSPTYNQIGYRIFYDLTTVLLFKATYFIFFLIFSLLSTSAVVYSVASIYTAKELTFKKVMTVVPKVWKRLMVTFLWNFIIIFFYNVIAAFFFIRVVIPVRPGTAKTIVLIALTVLYFCGVIYISVVWHLALVISVLEDLKGIKAMIKSKALIKGKKWIACAIFVKLNLAFVFIQFAFENLVVRGDYLGMGSRVLFGLVCFLLLMKLFLVGLVVQSVFYFVCKSYHHESIDKSCLADHLEVYLGDNEPLKDMDNSIGAI